MNKKVLWVVLLILFVGIIVFGGYELSKMNVKEKNNTVVANTPQKNASEDAVKAEKMDTYVKKELDDGVLYAIDGEVVEPDIVIGDNFFDTTEVENVQEISKKRYFFLFLKYRNDI